MGRLKLLFQKAPAIELKEWVTIDSQGLETKVELLEFAKADNLDDKLFVPPPVFLQKLQTIEADLGRGLTGSPSIAVDKPGDRLKHFVTNS